MSFRSFVFAATMTLCALHGHAIEPIAVRVVVRDSRSELVPHAYVALVPPYRPWSRPLVETVVDGGVAIFRVLPGSYRVVAAANGLGPKAVGPVPVSADARNEVAMVLADTMTVTGSVNDSNGNPVAGAQIQTAPAVIPPPLGKFSDLAVQTLKSGWSTTSDAQGQWTMSLPTDASTPLVIRKSGLGEAWHFFRPADPQPVDIALRSGGTARIKIDRVDPTLTVTLRRIGNPSPQFAPPDWEPLIHAQRGSEEWLLWDALQPGDYDVLTKYSEARAFGGASRKIGVVSIGPGEMRELTVTLPPAAPHPAQAFQLFLPNVADDELTDLEAYGADRNGEPLRVASVLEDATGGTNLYIDATRAHAPFYAAGSTHLITAAQQDSDATPVEGIVYSRADVNLHVRSGEKDLVLPPATRALFSGCEKERRVEIPAALHTDGLIRLPAPAGCKSVVFDFNPFEPVVASVAIRPAEVKSLGDFTLRAAGSAEFRVIRDPDDTPVAGAMVRIVATSDQGDAVALPSVETSSDGWARTTMLPVRRQLRASAVTADGDSSSTVSFTIEPRTLTSINRLAILKPSTLEIEAKLDPQFRQAFPDAVISEIRLTPVEGDRAREMRIVHIEGRERVEVDHVRPGRWRMLAVIRSGSGADPIDIEGVDVPSGKTTTVSRTIKPLVFTGRVSSHGNGVESKIDIAGPREAPSSIIRSINSAPDGSFKVVLAERDFYDVNVRRVTAQDMVIPIGEVSFSDPASPVQLVLPEGSLTVRVHSGDQPVAHATVILSLRRDASGGIETLETDLETDARGIAHFDSLPFGAWSVTASTDAPSRVAQKSVPLLTRDDTQIDLELSPLAGFSGVVRRSSGSPVTNAAIRCVVARGNEIPQIADAQTNGDGRFDLNIAAPLPPVARCGVAAPGGVVQGFRMSANTEANVTLAETTGSLEITRPERQRGTLWLVDADGNAVDLSRWLVRDRTALLPMLAAGTWKVVGVTSLAEWIALSQGNAASVAEASVEPRSSKKIEITN